MTVFMIAYLVALIPLLYFSWTSRRLNYQEMAPFAFFALAVGGIAYGVSEAVKALT